MSFHRDLLYVSASSYKNAIYRPPGRGTASGRQRCRKPGAAGRMATGHGNSGACAAPNRVQALIAGTGVGGTAGETGRDEQFRAFSCRRRFSAVSAPREAADITPLNRLAIFAAGFFSLSQIPMMTLIVPLWAADIGAGPLWIGIAVSLRAALAMVFSIQAGALMDRLGTARVCSVLGVAAALLASGRPLARASLGGGFIRHRSFDCGRVRRIAIDHVSSSPPKIPYVRFSRFKHQAPTWSSVRSLPTPWSRSGRPLARASVGRGFVRHRSFDCGRGRSSPIDHVSSSPPKIPYVRFSRFKHQAPTWSSVRSLPPDTPWSRLTQPYPRHLRAFAPSFDLAAFVGRCQFLSTGVDLPRNRPPEP